MSRVREHTRRTSPLLALATCLWTGCIFSPETGIIPPAPPPKLEKPADVIDALSRAYRERDPALFASLLANDPDRNAEYLFLLSEPTNLGETQWGYTEEVRIHQRMFRPESRPPGDPEVPAVYWLEALTITLSNTESFSDRPDLYSENGGLDGKLDRDIWRATEASYSTDVFFDMPGDLAYKVEGEANFVVIEDKTKSIGDSGKFLLYIWEDIAPPPAKPAAADGPA